MFLEATHIPVSEVGRGTVPFVTLGALEVKLPVHAYRNARGHASPEGFRTRARREQDLRDSGRATPIESVEAWRDDHTAKRFHVVQRKPGYNQCGGALNPEPLGGAISGTVLGVNPLTCLAAPRYRYYFF